MTNPGPSPLDRLSISAARLMTDHPPRLYHPNKQAVYDIACPPGVVHEGVIEYTRWASFALPEGVRVDGAEGSVEIRESIYDYEPALADAGAIEWHVNFADPALFFAYGGGLFAQDEVQCAEHPVLGAVREALIARGLPAVTVAAGRPTPVLVKGAQRRCRVATDRNPSAGRGAGLYGNTFARAPVDVVRRATTRIDPPTISNIVAMAASSGGYGPYSIPEIAHVLVTAFTAFRAVALESQPARTVVHTGFWGCGAFGGNRVLMSMLQILAAEAAGFDRIVLHAASPSGRKPIAQAIDLVRTIFAGHSWTPDDMMLRVARLGLEWGAGDGN